MLEMNTSLPSQLCSVLFASLPESGDKMGSVSPANTLSALANVLVIGAGSRGTAYSRAIHHLTSNEGVNARVAAIAEPVSFKRADFGRHFIWNESKEPGYGQSFDGWEQWLEWEKHRRSNPASSPTDYTPINAVLICTLDATHHPIITAVAPLNLHILCEKPLALSLSHCLSISQTLTSHPPKIISIGHVLRYSPHNILLRRLVCEDLTIGEIVSVEHTEPVGWWHFAHSYVRGNWRHETPEGIGSLLTKSCHDVDFLMWLLASPSKLTGGKVHEPSTIYSTGALTQFRRSKKPKAAGAATNCMSCPLRDEGCQYSAKRIYLDNNLRRGNVGWPVKIVAPEAEDIWRRTQDPEAAEQHLISKLSEDYSASTDSRESIAARSWYGRCVYESDNDVVDDQTVVISWDEDNATSSPFGRGPKSAFLHMIAPTLAQCERRGRIYGTLGEIAYDSSTITVHTFDTGATKSYSPNQDIEVGEGHGGGDVGLAGNFVRAVAAVEGPMGVEEAQMWFIGAGLEEMVMSHGVVMAAEESRRMKKVVRWGEWWEGARRRGKEGMGW